MTFVNMLAQCLTKWFAITGTSAGHVYGSRCHRGRFGPSLGRAGLAGLHNAPGNSSIRATAATSAERVVTMRTTAAIRVAVEAAAIAAGLGALS